METKKLKLKNKGPVVSLDVSPDGRLLAVGQKGNEKGDPNLTVWDIQTLQCVAVIEEERHEYVRSVSFNHDGSLLAYVWSRALIGLWDMRTLTRKEDTFIADKVQHIKFAPDSNLLLTCGKETRVWDIDNFRLVWEYSDYEAEGINGPIPAEILHDYYKLPERIASSPFYIREPSMAVFDSSERLIITGKNDGKFSVYDIRTGQCLKEHPGGVIQALFMEKDSPGNYLFLISHIPDANLFFNWNTMTRHLPQYFNENFYGASCFSFHPSSAFFAKGAKGGMVSLRNVSDGQFLFQEQLHKGCVNAVKFTVDGKQMISGSTDGKVILTDINTYIS